ncbi:Abhydrolase domain-containing protein [Artemisia annua]|uniref:Abhydrolase domain-containing protein n=1 Tax=Artemisia annua TaxID=35608 RepID=A0A2U1NDQ4_ARTAN|nr:Abhydrolase domain-containing protein [Artemisia annua]
MGGMTSSMAAKFAFFPPNPATYKLVKDEVTGLLLLTPFPHRENVEILKLNTRKGSEIVAVYGTADDVVDFNHGKQLWELCKEKYEPLWIKGGNHCDLELYPEYIRHLKKFISTVEKSPSHRHSSSRRSTDHHFEQPRRSTDHHFEQPRRSTDHHFEQPRRSTDVFDASRKSTDRREKPRKSMEKPKVEKLEKMRMSFDQMERSRRSVDVIEKSRKSVDLQMIDRGRKSVDRLDRLRSG